MVTRNVEKIPDTESNHELISCEICLKSIPKSDSTSAEADDYIAYFCGLECYDQWVKSKHDK
ncbi:MAG: DUF3330 domain-containing protein [Gammaproteobacteria bacterium]|nr:DUF3330 domain-containing protein [Gammaproteobacteria bacterium]